MTQTLLDYVNMENITRVNLYNSTIPTNSGHLRIIGELLSGIEVECSNAPDSDFDCQYESMGDCEKELRLVLKSKNERTLKFLLKESQSISFAFRKRYGGAHIHGTSGETSYHIFIRGD